MEKKRGRFPAGVEGRPLDKIGYHGFSTWNLTLDAVRVPAANRLGEGPSSDLALDPGGGFQGVEDLLNVARVHTAARVVRLARGAFEDCVLYVQERCSSSGRSAISRPYDSRSRHGRRIDQALELLPPGRPPH